MDKINFYPALLAKRLWVTQAASYAALGAFTYAMGGFGVLLVSAALYGGLHVALKTQAMKKNLRRKIKPPFLGKGGVAEPAPADIQGMTDDLCRKAGMDPVPVTMFGGRHAGNAFAMIDRLYIGKDLAAKMSKDELRYVLAHELAHIKTNDSALLPVLNMPQNTVALQYIAAIATAMMTGTGPANAGQAAVFLGAYVGAMLGQRALASYSSRLIEKRADYNAIQLTKNFEAAASCQAKLEAMHGFLDKKPGFLTRIFNSHPQGEARLANLKKAFNEVAAAEKKKDVTNDRHPPGPGDPAP